MTEVLEPCNCPWLKCPVHELELCVNTEWDWRADEQEQHCRCGKPHRMGDHILGQGIHLCGPCADKVFDLMVHGTTATMHDLQQELPRDILPLNSILADYFIGKAASHEAWTSLYSDVKGLFRFVQFCLPFIHDQDRILRITTHVVKVRELRDAYAAKKGMPQ